MNVRVSNATWPRPEPEPDTVSVIVDRVRRLSAGNIAIVEGTTAEGVPVRALLGTETTLRLGRQVAVGRHPEVSVPAFALLEIPETD